MTMSPTRSLRALGFATEPRRLGYLAGLAVVLFGACSTSEEEHPYADQTVAACVADNHPDDGHGWESDIRYCPSGPPGSPPMECEPVTPQDIVSACESAGHPCDADSFITRDAAICVAHSDGLEDGLEPWYVHMVYHSGYERPIWSVGNTTVDDPADCSQSGRNLHIDAETGEILERLMWNSIC